MILKTIEFTDHNGKAQKEDFHFHISKGELVMMEMAAVDGQYEGMTDKIQRLMKTREGKEIVAIFKDIIATGYGIKTSDGRFMKEDAEGRPLVVHFRSTEAYSELAYELATDAEAGAKFINGLIPQALRDDVKKEVAQRTAPQDYQKKQESTVQVVKDPVVVEAPPTENLNDLSKEDLIARLAQR
jgi:hypothetical protein